MLILIAILPMLAGTREVSIAAIKPGIAKHNITLTSIQNIGHVFTLKSNFSQPFVPAKVQKAKIYVKQYYKSHPQLDGSFHIL